MSLIPYASDGNREIVLRRGNAVVVYDAASRQLQVREAPGQTLELTDCPYCHRPLREDYRRQTGNDSEDGNYATPGDPGQPFTDPDYFAMLAASTRASPSSSGPGTPTGRRLLHPALRSGRSRDVSGAGGPPSGAEFVASEPMPASSKGISSSSFSQGYYAQHFTEERELGRGGNGVVLLVEHHLDGIVLGHFACKRIPVGNNHAWLEKVLIEVNLLRKYRHENIVSCHFVWLEDYQASPFGPSIPCLWILQEYCNGGDLHGYVLGPKDDANTTKEKMKQRMRRRSKGELSPVRSTSRGLSRLSFEEIFSFFRDITTGLHFLHSKGYIHRDLKPSNCLLHRDGSNTRILISDFGEVQAAGSKRANTGATGTISYCAPEVLERDSGKGAFGDFTTKSDIFSLGMIVYFMCFGRLPYINANGVDEESEDLDLLRAEITAWPGLNDEMRSRTDLPERLYKYLKRLLSVDPNQRPSTEEILASIKGGSSIGEVASNMTEDGSPRVSSLDSPSRRPTPQPRRTSTVVSRPGLSTLRRQMSDTKSTHRSPSPMKRDGSRQSSDSKSRPASADSAVVLSRPKKIELPAVSSRDESEEPTPQQSPRLMLPPPPQRPVANAMHRTLNHRVTKPLLNTLLFLVKLAMLALPCSPFAINSWLLYPLLGLAGLELGLLGFDARRSMSLFILHIAFVYTARQHELLCEGTRSVWEDM